MIASLINIRKLLVLSSFLFVLLAFITLFPKSAYATHPDQGFGWTNVVATVPHCAGTTKSQVHILLGVDNPIEFSWGTLNHTLTMTIRRIDNDFLVYQQSRVGFVFTSLCIFEPENHYITVVSSSQGWRPLYTKFVLENPSGFKEKLITFHAHKVGIGFGDYSVNHASPADGVWFNYNNPTLILNGNSAGSSYNDYDSSQIKRVNLEVQEPTGTTIKRVFGKGWSFGPINLGPQTFNDGDGLYNWGAFIIAEGLTTSDSVSSFSTWRSFGIDTQLPTANCSISPVSPPDAHYSTTTVTVTLSPTDPAPSSGIPEGELQVSTDNWVTWTTISTQTSGTYDHDVVGDSTYEFRYKVRDGTVDISGSTANSWSGYFDCGTVTIPDWPSPDLIIYYQENPAGTYIKNQIISSYKPPTIYGSREFVTDTDVYLHGSVKNLGGTIFAGTPVKVKVEGNWSFFDDTQQVDSEFTLIPVGGDWENNEVVPFGTACGDVNGDGRVFASDVIAITVELGSNNPDYDLDDDGWVLASDVSIANNQLDTTCTRNIKFTTPSVVNNLFSGDIYGVKAIVDPDGGIYEAGFPDGENNNQAFDIYTVFESGTFSISVSPPSIFMLLNDTKEVQVNLNFGGVDWDENTEVVLEAIDLPPEITAKFIDPVNGNNPTIPPVTKGSIGSLVSLYFTTNDATVWDYPIKIKATVTQSVPYAQLVATTSIQIIVREEYPWFISSNGGDVGAQGEIGTKPPGSSIINDTFPSFTTAGDPDRTHGVCHNVNQLINDPIPHNDVILTSNPFLVGYLSFADRICRAYLNFDTSSIPAEANITSAKLVFDYENLWTVLDEFDVDLVEKDWASLPDEIDVTALDNNWHQASESEQFLFNTVDLNTTGGGGATETYSVDLADPSVINSGGSSKFEIKASDEQLLLAAGILLLFNMNIQAELQVTYILYPPPPTDTNFLVIANDAITGFNNFSDWVVSGYSNSENIDHRLGLDPYKQLWDEFGKKADPTSDGVIPAGSGVYVYDGDFTYGNYGAPVSGPGEIVLFINGGLSIESNINLTGEKRVVFIVRDDVDVAPTVSTLDGFFVVGGTFASGLITGLLGAKSASSAESVSSGNVSWTNPSNALTSNVSYASVSLPSEGVFSEDLKVTNFNFTIPPGSDILGIQVEIEKWQSPDGGIGDNIIFLVKDGGIENFGSASGAPWPTSDTDFYTSYGGSTDLWGSQAGDWKAADINNSEFGVVFQAICSAAFYGGLCSGSSEANVDHIRVTVFYELCNSCQLTVTGGVIAFNGFNLERGLFAVDATDPAELFIYDPSYLYLFAKENLLGKRNTIRTELPP